MTEMTSSATRVAHLLREAGNALGHGQANLADRGLSQVLALDPGNVEAQRLLGIAALVRGDYQRAIAHLRSVVAAHPDDPSINMTLGNALVETGETKAGLDSLRRACELAPGMAAAWYNLGRALQMSAQVEQAHGALQRAVAIEPGYVRARNALATVLTNLGNIPAAVTLLRETLRDHPDNADAWFALGSIKTERLTRGDTAHLQRLFRQSGSPDDTRILLGFTLAKALEDQSDYAAAFDMVHEANALKRQSLYWSRSEERARVEAISEAFSTPIANPLDAELGREIIFVVSLPRSGSTLVEQILAAHPEVTGGDEFQALPEILDEESARRGTPFPQWVSSTTADNWHRMGTAYLARARRWRPQHVRLTDKNISNWAFVGAALAMLPGARVINARRDLVETCFASYRQLFATGVHFSYDLDDMVDYCAGYERLSALWQRQFPQRYFDHHYELLQQDPEGQIHRVLDFCALPFDTACLSFHQTPRTVLTFSSAQVRQPLRLDTARAALYGNRLDPLRARLHAAGLLSTSP